jgi:hypothetical protein
MKRRRRGKEGTLRRTRPMGGSGKSGAPLGLASLGATPGYCRPAGRVHRRASGPHSGRGHSSPGVPDNLCLLSWLNLRGRNFSDCALQSAMQRSPLFLPSSNSVRACLACSLFHFLSIDFFPIPQDRRLAQQTKLLKERNASLLRAVATVKQNPSSSTVFVPGTTEECVLINIFDLRFA